MIDPGDWLPIISLGMIAAATALGVAGAWAIGRARGMRDALRENNEMDTTRERVESMLRRFPERELDDMKADDGDVVVTCQFCNIDFRFDDAQLARLHVELPH